MVGRHAPRILKSEVFIVKSARVPSAKAQVTTNAIMPLSARTKE